MIFITITPLTYYGSKRLSEIDPFLVPLHFFPVMHIPTAFLHYMNKKILS